MNNVLFETLPTTWNGYRINTGFHIGVQISLLMEDRMLSERTKTITLLMLLFGDEKGECNCPETIDEVGECLEWFLNGWNHDNNLKQEQQRKIMDYNVDQGRIFADFMRFYGIDLETTEMHWWKFCWLLWNLPYEKSSFMQVIEIRTKTPRKGASSEERKAIKKGHDTYDLKQNKIYSKAEKDAIDKYDAMLAELKKNR